MLLKLAEEYGDDCPSLTYAIGEGIDEATPGRLKKRLLRHADSVVHRRTVTLQAGPDLSRVIRPPVACVNRQRLIRATEEQVHALLCLTINVATATSRGEGLRGVIDRIRDDEMKVPLCDPQDRCHVLCSH